MSMLGSSVINKSGKKLAPKAPVPRVAGSTSTQNSARASVDRHNLSQTPQPQSQSQAQSQAQHETKSQLQLQPQSRNSQRSGSTQETITATPSSPQPNTPPPSIVIGGSDNIVPTAKRRKIQERQEEIPTVSTASRINVNVPLPSTETNGVVAEAPENAGPQSSNKQSRPEQLVKTPQPAKARKPQASSEGKRKQRVEIPEAETAADTARGSSTPKGKVRRESKKPRTKKPKPRTQEEQNVENAAAEFVADAIQGSSAKRKTKRHRTRRESTPEGAEDVRIVPSEVKMSDLCKNFRTGRKSAREVELEKIEKAELIQKKQRELQEVMGEGDASGQVSESGDQRLERLAREQGDREEASRAVPNTVIVDGQIQIDETSLQLDRHAKAAEERDAEQLEGVDESELTRSVNQGSWAKRDKSGSWNEESTDKFYDGLRMFGTDFEMISKLFPGRTRHSVKLKFCKEEKLDQQKIKRTLMGERIPVDMEEYSKISNTTYADPKELERELDEDRKRMEAEHAAEKEAIDEIRRQREAEAAAEGAAVGDDSSAKENRDATQGTASARERKGKKAARVKKKSGRGNRADAGSQEVVLGPIDEMARQEAASVDN